MLLIPKYTAASELLLFGVVANYAATTADTLSSELGILSPSKPRLILTGNVCPPGTNGGVSLVGLLAGSLGAAVIGVVALLSGAPWEGFAGSKVGYVFFVAAIGTAGSVVDSVLGALFQETVTDVRTGKVVEAPGGGRVLIAPGERSVGKVKDEMVKIGKGEKDAKILERHKVEDRADVDELFDKGPSRKVSAGQWGLLTNNGVNLVMAGMATVGGMVSVAGVEGVVEAVGEAVKKGIEVAGLQL